MRKSGKEIRRLKHFNTTLVVLTHKSHSGLLLTLPTWSPGLKIIKGWYKLTHPSLAWTPRSTHNTACTVTPLIGPRTPKLMQEGREASRRGCISMDQSSDSHSKIITACGCVARFRLPHQGPLVPTCHAEPCLLSQLHGARGPGRDHTGNCATLLSHRFPLAPAAQ